MQEHQIQKKKKRRKAYACGDFHIGENRFSLYAFRKLYDGNGEIHGQIYNDIVRHKSFSFCALRVPKDGFAALKCGLRPLEMKRYALLEIKFTFSSL